ncbi:hypothetical protein [Actinoplanes italicus]|uniref:Uncharacterized protein n=1 Tax=Actinoplanes italicus TaxID=113567 RepID=A0A2T0K1C4_9ACTN|nr:hypothetical protein [Actinoplanes italicus]PRX16550.1 hypothetical protein CLV67_119131 [Actinoplanes italicus]
MPLTIDDLLDDALAENESATRVGAVEDLVPYLSGSQRSRAWAATAAAVGTVRASTVLRDLAPFAGPDELAAALDALRRLPASSSRHHGIAALLPHLTGTDRQSVENELIRAIASDTGGYLDGLVYFARAGFTSDGLARVVGATIEAGRPGEAATLRELLPPDLRRAVMIAGAALTDEHARAAVLNAMAPTLTQQDVADVAPAARAITDPLLRARVLTTLGCVSAPLAEEALATVLEFEGEIDRLLWILPDLAPRLSRMQLDELIDRLAVERSGDSRMWTIGKLTPYLDAEQHERALAAVGVPDMPEMWLYGAAEFLPHLPPELRVPLQNLCVRLMSDRGMRGGTGGMVSHLRVEQIDQLLRQMAGPDGDLSMLYLLVPNLSDEQVGFALEAVLAHPDAGTRVDAAEALAPRLDAAMAARTALALFGAGPERPDGVDSSAFVAACGALAARIDGESRRALIEAGAAAAEKQSGYGGAWGLIELAPAAVDEAHRDALLARAIAVVSAGDRTGHSTIRKHAAELLATGRPAVPPASRLAIL